MNQTKVGYKMAVRSLIIIVAWSDGVMRRDCKTTLQYSAISRQRCFENRYDLFIVHKSE